MLFKNEFDRLLASDITRIVSSIGIDRVGGGGGSGYKIKHLQTVIAIEYL